MGFVKYCIPHKDFVFESKFQLTENVINNDANTILFLLKELENTRFDFSSIKINYQTIAEISGLFSHNLDNFWLIIEPHLIEFPHKDPDYIIIEKQLSGISDNSQQIKFGIDALKFFVIRTRQIIHSNFEGLKKSNQKQMGILGETISYLYVRDIKNADCIFSKIIPDNPSMPRHGMDLLSIHFGTTQEEDVVRFWEVKSTTNHFDDRCKEIVDWFNKDSESHLTMAIEAAKLDWREKFPSEKFHRASSVLAKFMYSKRNYSYVGAIVYDGKNSPTDEKIRKFDKIMVEKEKKWLVLFIIEDLQEVLNGVFGKLCKI